MTFPATTRKSVPMMHVITKSIKAIKNRWAGRILIDAARMRHRWRVMARTRAARREAGAA